MRELQEKVKENRRDEHLILHTAVRLIIPYIQLFGLYVIAHGHYSPGGGFQGGVILGASVILLAIAFDLPTSNLYIPEEPNAIFSNAGVLIYTGVGLLCALLGGFFLDYSALSQVIPLSPVEWRSMGIFLVELGVGLAVMSIMISLYRKLASAGQMEEGL